MKFTTLSKLNPPEWVRKWLYGVFIALVPVLIAYGVIAEEDAPLWVGLGTAVFGFGLATANTDGKPRE